jgi:hypothetical protein
MAATCLVALTGGAYEEARVTCRPWLKQRLAGGGHEA